MTDYAIENLNEIQQYYVANYVSMSNVVKLINELVRSVAVLETLPYTGRVVPEYNVQLVRELIRGKYRIIYQISDRVINILAFYHQARLLPKNVRLL
ncbi:hypothetical protein EZS27_027993 [termite gut metagenome]|uniref:Uncharacterized protein n=1 Tax=termite gut metagenome TaxID=433724 RepID=A0A5J4QKP1_9ZZZZ